MRVIFLGTPEFAVLPIKSIAQSKHDLLCVISQPDRETDRKKNLLPTPAKKAAQELGIEVFQFEKVSRDGLETVRKFNPDVIVTAAFGQLLSQEFLDIPKFGVLNIHASLLPAYRGSSPIQAAILNGETESGVTVMRTVLKMDAGEILLRKSLPIDDKTTYLSLSESMSSLGADMIVKALDMLESGSAAFTPQDENKATYTKKIAKSDGLIDFSVSADKIVRQINAFNPWPSAYVMRDGEPLKIFSARAVECGGEVGKVISVGKSGFTVACGSGALEILEIQAAGKRRMGADEYLRGAKINVGERFSD